MTTAFLMVDVQQDFLNRPNVVPPPFRLVERLAFLLEGARQRGWPVFHMRTCIDKDGYSRMPHWVDKGICCCVAGTPGYEAPYPLAATEGETVLHKRFFSGFDSPELLPALQKARIETLIIAGLYTHGCIRATVLDAYAHGFKVFVAEDAVGSTEPMHAELGRCWLEERAARFVSTGTLLSEALPPPQSSLVPESCAAAAHSRFPALEPSERAALLYRWADALQQEQESLIRLLADEIGKPRADAADEVRRTLAHIRVAAGLILEAPEPPPIPGVRIFYRPIGTVGLITPWNNPLAIPAGKLAPALAWGNTCVWKPAPETPLCSQRLYESLLTAGLPENTVQLVAGDAQVAREIVKSPYINALSLTGSSATGAGLAALCTLHGKPLQAELGGNNAALILDDWAMDQVGLTRLVLSIFGFAGQRCTAIRRLIVQKGILPHFIEAFTATVHSLKLGDPHDPATMVGPLISVVHQRLVSARLDAALAAGARVAAQTPWPDDADGGLWAGRWFPPTVLVDVDPDSAIVQEETFGPIAVLLPADDLDGAINLANSVPQGLVAAIYTQDPSAQARFAQQLQTGMLKLGSGPLAIAAEAPFCGWKSSAIGPPEHGLWDRDFYARVQVLYL
jgi:acyl-CoA reductase-like NAD-dependent aldehyde dehydrogenase/nicotinamidase-related amidase